MSMLAQRKMTADEFLAWAEGQEGRWELHDGEPFRMPSEQLDHVDVKYAVYFTLVRAVRRAGLPSCHVVGDGAGVRISRDVVYGPDALVYCGPKLPGNLLEVPNPVVLVEVISPSTRKFDDTMKRDDYFSLPSVHHYLIVDPNGPPVIHYSRQADGRITRSAVDAGTLTLSPPGLEVGVSEMLAGVA
jgi:Uma2 family endonuclease